MSDEIKSGRALANMIDNLRYAQMIASDSEATAAAEPALPQWTPARAKEAREYWLAAGRLAGLREAAEMIEAHAKDMMAYRDHHYVAKHLRAAKAAILALAEGKKGA